MEEANIQTKIIERDLQKLGDRFDRHLEIYAQNGKELSGVKASLENHNKTADRITERLLDHETRINANEINIAKLAVRVAGYAAVASAVASAVAVTIVESVFI